MTDRRDAADAGDTRTGPLLQCTAMSRSFGDRLAVDAVSFSVAAGECYGLLGPNGAGKTTAISMVCGVLSPDAGTITIGGHRPTGRSAHHAKRALGYVPQAIALFPELTVAENVDFWARLTEVPRKRRAARIAAVLDQVGLTDRADDVLSTTSGGMQRRANLAVALVHEPQLLVLDEPTVGVDPQSRNRLLALVESITAAGTAVIYTSHYMEEVARVAHRVGIMDGGRIVAEGTVDELLASSSTGVSDLEGRFLELTGAALRD